MIHYKKFPFTEIQWKLPCSEEASTNSCHESNNPNISTPFINMDILFSSNQCVAAQSVQ